MNERKDGTHSVLPVRRDKRLFKSRLEFPGSWREMVVGQTPEKIIQGGGNSVYGGVDIQVHSPTHCDNSQTFSHMTPILKIRQKPGLLFYYADCTLEFRKVDNRLYKLYSTYI
jgi:hypothetical protein